MRTTIAVLAAILSFVLTLAAGPVVWLDRNVVNRDGFVATMMPLGQDETFREDLAVAIGRRVATDINVPQKLQPVVDGTVTAAARGMFQLPGFPEAWRSTLERSHDLSIGPGAASTTSAFNLDVAPLVDLVAGEASKKLPVKLTGPKVAVISFGTLDQRQMIDPVLRSSGYGVALAIGAGIAFLLALVSARRRGAFLMVMGIGAAIIAAMWKAAAFVGVGILGQRLGNELEGMVVARIGNVVSGQIDQVFWVLLVAGLVMFVAGIVIESIRRRHEIAAARQREALEDAWEEQPDDGVAPGV
ncbi:MULTISPECIES: hypothetical protein [Arthrobacter]|uniref:ABC transporter permease n=2 Tax=Arthrobacter TaxID=1663 RepID=A0ABU9KK13_9MICC|nr:hypothetical protein [Arthrobacter sp. YJM1]MDP5227088.1 hypothetical protein [Arthrobacter sp. YJM1]